jgi:hypothetical protein
VQPDVDTPASGAGEASITGGETLAAHLARLPAALNIDLVLSTQL